MFSSSISETRRDWDRRPTICSSRQGSSPYWRTLNKLRIFITPVVQIAGNQSLVGFSSTPCSGMRHSPSHWTPPGFPARSSQITNGGKIKQGNQTSSMQKAMRSVTWTCCLGKSAPTTDRGGQGRHLECQGSPLRQQAHIGSKAAMVSSAC